jgi:hypothetical protein
MEMLRDICSGFYDIYLFLNDLHGYKRTMAFFSILLSPIFCWFIISMLIVLE